MKADAPSSARVHSLLSLALFMFCACDASGTPNPDAATSYATAPPWSALPNADGALVDGFTNPFSLVERADGTVLVSDRAHGELWHADFQTGSRKFFGRSGDGPGEYRSALEVFPFTGDSVAVFAFMVPSRLSVMDKDGSPQRTIRLSAYADQRGAQADFAEYPLLSRTDSTHRLYGARLGARAVGGGLNQWLDSVPIMRMNVSTGVIDTVATLPVGESVGWKTPQPNDQAFTVGLGPFATRNDWAVMPDGTVVMLDARTFTLSFVREGTVLRSVAVAVTDSFPVDQSLWERHVDSATASVKNTPMFRAGVGAPPAVVGGTAGTPAIKVPAQPKYWPAVLAASARMHTAADRFWIPASGPRSPGRQYWSVVDTLGAVLGRFELAPSTVLIAVSAQYVYTARIDEDDLRWVSRHRNPIQR